MFVLASGPGRWRPWSLLAVAGILALLPGCATLGERSTFMVRSQPPGALVSGIGGEYGVTPLRLDERRVYPNDYPDAKAQLYGKLVFSRPGCETVTHRLSMSEFKTGVDVRLVCNGRGTPGVPKEAPAEAAAASAGASASLPERRLRQLRTLDELLEEGLITPAEERSIRRRIFERLDGTGH